MRMFENPATAIKPRPFGRAKDYLAVTTAEPSRAAEDLRLFAITFACGFLFVTVFIA